MSLHYLTIYSTQVGKIYCDGKVLQYYFAYLYLSA